MDNHKESDKSLKIEKEQKQKDKKMEDKAKELDCDELADMDEDELRKLLLELGDTEDTLNFDRQDLLDYIVDEHAQHCFSHLHSKGQDYDYSDLHPDETVEEFKDHEN